MGTVRRITAAAGAVTLGQAADAYLATLNAAEHANTRRVYGRILARVAAEFGGRRASSDQRRAVRGLVRPAVGPAGPVHVERLAGCRPVRRGVLAAAGLDRR